MAKEFSLAHLTLIDCDPPELIYIAARTGYDFVGIRSIFIGLPAEPDYSLANNKSLLKRTKSALSETGIKLLDIELARIIDNHHPKEYEPSLEVAAELGCRHVLSSIWTDDTIYAIERFSELCELAKQYGLTVELEFVPIASVNTLTGALYILNKANQENAGLLIDIHHFHRSKENVEALDQIPKNWFHYLHLCDAPGEIPDNMEEMTRILREERLFVGVGGIDIASIVNRIPEVPYAIELPNKKLSKELGKEKFAKLCLETAKAYLAAHPRETNSSNIVCEDLCNI